MEKAWENQLGVERQNSSNRQQNKKVRNRKKLVGARKYIKRL